MNWDQVTTIICNFAKLHISHKSPCYKKKAEEEKEIINWKIFNSFITTVCVFVFTLDFTILL